MAETDVIYLGPDLERAKSDLVYQELLLEALDPDDLDYAADKQQYEQDIETLQAHIHELEASLPNESPRAALALALAQNMDQANQTFQTPAAPASSRLGQVHYPNLYNGLNSSSSSASSFAELPFDATTYRKRPRESTLTSPQHASQKFPRITPSPSVSGASSPHSVDSLEGLNHPHTFQNANTNAAGIYHANLAERAAKRSNSGTARVLTYGQNVTQDGASDAPNNQRHPYTNQNVGSASSYGRPSQALPKFLTTTPSRTNLDHNHTHVKKEPGSSSRHNMNTSAPRSSGPPTIIDLTGDDDDDESDLSLVQAFNHQNGRLAQPKQHTIPPSQYNVGFNGHSYHPAAQQYGPSQLQPLNGNSWQNLTGMPPFDADRLYNAARGFAGNIGGAIRDMGGLLFPGTGPINLDSDDDDDYGQFPDHRDWEPAPAKTREQLEELLESIQTDETQEDTPHQLNIELKVHQKIGLAWLRKMEEGTNKGSILADDMGLGKTVQAMALIVARPSRDRSCKTNLIIAPLALMKQWAKEIKSKIHSRYALSVYLYHGASRKQDFQYLRTFDCVFTTYGTLATELKKKAKFLKFKEQNPNHKPTAKDRFPLLADGSKWYRVILDEAQGIKNKNSLTARAAGELHAIHRLCMTGTPMMNNVLELYSLVKFLDIKPYCYWNRFRNDISTPINKWQGGNEPAMEKLRVLWKAIALRRKKDSKIGGLPIIVIPPKEVEQVHVVFDEEQKQVYDALQNKTQAQFNKYLEKGKVMNNYANMLVLLLRLRQACCHPHLINDLSVGTPGEMTVDSMRDLATQFAPDVVNRIKEMDGNFQCPVCLDATENPSLSFPCGHVLCLECYARVTDPANVTDEVEGDRRPKCPSCRERLDVKKVVDYRSFGKVHMPETFPDEDAGEASDDESDDGEASDEDDDTELEASDLDGFIVDDDDDGEDEEEYSRKQQVAKARREARKGKGKVKSETTDDHGFVKDEDDNFGSTLTTKSRAHSKVKKPKKEPKMTLAQLKKESRKSKAARAKYLRKLQKKWVDSAKLKQTMHLLRDIRQKDPQEKTIIFSQWTSLLDLLEIPINREGWGYQRYDGQMKFSERIDAIEEFTENPRCTILLTSLKAGNAGLNLHQASQVIMLDPFWNPYIEEQAVDRAHRFPQQRTVYVHRMLVQETVEDRIMALQDKKKALIEAAMDEAASQNIGRLGVDEFKYLFGLGPKPR